MSGELLLEHPHLLLAQLVTAVEDLAAKVEKVVAELHEWRNSYEVVNGISGWEHGNADRREL